MLNKTFTGKTRLVAKRIFFKQYIILEAEVHVYGTEHYLDGTQNVDEKYFEAIDAADLLQFYPQKLGENIWAETYQE